MEAAGQVAGSVSFNIAVLKEPRGFIKPIQWDFIVSAIIVLLWLISSSAWAQGVSDVKYYTDLNSCGVFKNMKEFCAGSTISFKETMFPNFASLNVSVIFGFLNMLVWAGNLWFLWKETPWSKMQSKPATMSGQDQGNQKI
ncbi:hypothetical protein CHS0354_022112 [Potamilus streckersoni]|uniref:MARVEL domain-containing protein n=1 Tax=Potamilus streckersoni TaxID=2493646 RepID=A0AAE0SBG8_9BIVA|nr:hypothetical protein CHS0354_022112 [Potamilus streckersoni]